MIRFKGFLVLSALAVLGGCGGGSGGGDAPSAGPGAVADTTAPTVASIVPAEGATAIAINGSISATFSEPMDTSFGATTFTVKPAAGGAAIGGTVAFSGNTATFTPSTNLDAGITYTATITTTAKDVAGNPLGADKAWNFTTGAVEDKTAPTVSSTTPSELATGIALSPVLTSTFSEAMTASTSSLIFTLAPTAGGAAIAGTVNLSGTTVTFTPGSSLTASTQYTATITTGAKDAAGNPLAANKVWKFTTGLAPDTTAPTVTSTSPADGATGVGLSPVLTATFSEAMTASTSSSIFTLAPTAGGAVIVGTVSLSGTTATFTPSSSLTADTLYTATVTTGAKDASGNFLAANKVWSFRTAAPASSGGPYTGSYLFYKGIASGNNNSWSLSVVDSAHPGTSIAVEPGTDVNSDLSDNTVVVTATYDAATKSFTNIHNYAIVYAKSDGKFYKVSALKGGGIGAPTRMSNEAMANTICDSGRDYTPDFANPEASQFVYATPGPDSTCGNDDDVFKMVRLGMSASEAPITAKRTVTSLFNGSTGAIAGWLVNDSGNLKRCDSNFANCSASLKSIGGATTHWAAEAQTLNRLLLPIGEFLYVYNEDANTLSSSLISNFNGVVGTDGDKFYFAGATSGSSSTSIYSVPVDGSAPPTVLVTDPASIENMYFTPNKLVYTTATATAIRAVAKAGGAATTLVSLAAGTHFGEVQVVANHIYYTIKAAYPAQVPTAGVIDDDGTGKSETPNAAWVGWFLDTATWSSEHFRTVVRAEGFNSQGVGKAFAGGTLRSFNTANRAEIAVLGVIPSDIGNFNCGTYGGSVEMLCSGTDSASESDLFFLNAETADSLVRITTTPSLSEHSLGY